MNARRGSLSDITVSLEMEMMGSEETRLDWNNYRNSRQDEKGESSTTTSFYRKMKSKNIQRKRELQ
jgi:hypothetical protein